MHCIRGEIDLPWPSHSAKLNKSLGKNSGVTKAGEYSGSVLEDQV